MSWHQPLGRRLRSVTFSSMRGYRASWLSADLLAAMTLLVIAVPEQLATARLAGMPPVVGFYAFIAGSVMFAALGSSRRMSVGGDSTIAPLFAVGVGALATAGSPRYVGLVGIVAVTVGVLVALVGLLRLGWIAEFLSKPIISGFLAGVAIIIVVHQLPDLLGLPAGGGSTVHRLVVVFGHLGDANGWTVGLGVGVMATVIVAERINRRLPGALIALVVTTGLVAVLDLSDHGVAILGGIAHGLPQFGLRGLTWSALSSVLALAGVVALVVISQTSATTRAFADKGDDGVDVNRDFLGVGAGSVVAGLLGAFPVNASPPRTAVVVAASGRTQLTGLTAALGIAALIPAAWILRDVPLATLAGVLILVAARIFRLKDLIVIARFDVVEFGLAGVTLVTVALIGVEQGIGVAVGLAILDRTRLSARPQLHVLGRIPGTTSWTPINGVEAAVEVPGVLVVLFATPLWYANSTRFRTEVSAAISQAHGELRLVVLDVVGMSDIDYTGSQVLGELLDQLDRDQLGFVIARAGGHVRTSLARSGLLQRIGAEHLYASVDEAATAPFPAGDRPKSIGS